MQSGVLNRAIGYADLGRQARKLKNANQEVVRDNARVHLAERMGKLRGLPQKIGQILSMGADAEESAAFANLTDQAEPLRFEDIEPVLEQTWGVPLNSVIRDIDRHGLAASLGQVHRATLCDGREVAVKVRYPGIDKAVMNDLKMLGWLSVPVGDLRRGFDLNAYRAEILRDLKEELDYGLEARHQNLFRGFVADNPDWVVPQVVPELSCENVLVSEWETGVRIEAASTWPSALREQLATTLIRGFLRTLFHHGYVHADPHPGNYRFGQTPAGPRVILYDYGSVARIRLEYRIALLKLIEMSAKRAGNPYRPLVALGFDEQLLGPIRGKLAAVFDTLFEPFRSPMKYDLSTWNRAERLEDILGEDRWNFRMSGPANLILLMRAFTGLIYYVQRLDRPVSWSIALAPCLAEHREALDRFDSEAVPVEPGSFDALAAHLRIRIREKGADKVSLTLPATAVENLPELMDDDLVQRIEARGTSLERIVRSVRRNGYNPQELFTLHEPERDKTISVWLE